MRELLEQAGHEVVEAPPTGFGALEESGALLTPREIEVLGAIGEGLTNKAIARRLEISLHTVKFHLESVFRKLGARTRTEALAKAAERRLDLGSCALAELAGALDDLRHEAVADRLFGAHAEVALHVGEHLWQGRPGLETTLAMRSRAQRLRVFPR